jgi:flavin reductase (DIM6/NTAB) family NADH-FMN oxidoreductase RutF
MPETAASIDPQWFRHVLGQYPTGVCVVTAENDAEGIVGMVVGSFSSASLDPPLVSFYVDRKSTSWPKIARAVTFCVNVLGADQEDTCRRLSSKDPNKFASESLRRTVHGSPILEQSVAWVECRLDSILDAGDHYLVLGSVLDLQLEQPRLPLLFFRGGYGRFSPSSLAAPDSHGRLTRQLREVDIIRPAIESLSAQLQARCAVAARVEDEIVVLASAGDSERPSTTATLVGQHLPFAAPMGAVFAAWNGDDEVDHWLAEVTVPERRSTYQTSLVSIRARGYSVGLLSEGHRALASKLDELAVIPSNMQAADFYGLVERLESDPPTISDAEKLAIRQITAPVFGVDGRVELTLSVYGFPKPPNGIDEYISQVVQTADHASGLIGSQVGSSAI